MKGHSLEAERLTVIAGVSGPQAPVTLRVPAKVHSNATTPFRAFDQLARHLQVEIERFCRLRTPAPVTTYHALSTPLRIPTEVTSG